MENKQDIRHKIKILKALDADIKESESINREEAYRQTRIKIRNVSRRRTILSLLNRAAAILILPLIISTIVLSYILIKEKQPLSPVSYTEVTALPGSIIKTTLPDFSEVSLNSGSTLRYSNSFSSSKRSVELTGEAFFKVQSNPESPFEVQTGEGVTVTAYGTSFNVNAYSDAPVTEAVLKEGSIDVHYKENKIVVNPNEMVRIDKVSGSLKKTKVNIEEKTGWKEGLLIFRNTPLEEALKKISKRYNVEVILHKETNTDYRIRATFSSETLFQVMDILKMAAPISWSEKEREQSPDLSYSGQCIEVWIK